jgi:hypothetical protein
VLERYRDERVTAEGLGDFVTRMGIEALPSAPSVQRRLPLDEVAE